MITEVIMKRDLFGQEISQKSKSGFFSATELVRAGNMWRIANKMEPFHMIPWLATKSTKEFITELEKKYGTIKISGRGRSTHTWVHPLLFIDMALSISPSLKIEVYEWLFDHLLKFRNDSGDSYKEMAAALYTRCTNKKEFPKQIAGVASTIQAACGVRDWQAASETQLKKRDKIHMAVRLYSNVLTDVNKIIELSILEVK